jgi:hypothetical protein
VVLLGAAALSGPSELLGRANQPAPALPADPARAAVVSALSQLISDSHRVLAVHQRGASPYVELVLWLTDHREPGTLNADELVLLCHSQVLQTITTYTDATCGGSGAIDLSDAATRGFCDRWRSDPAVQSRVLAGGISDLQVALLTVQPSRPTSPMAARSGMDGARVSLRLIWPPVLTDSPEEAFVVIDAKTEPSQLNQSAAAAKNSIFIPLPWLSPESSQDYGSD